MFTSYKKEEQESYIVDLERRLGRGVERVPNTFESSAVIRFQIVDCFAEQVQLQAQNGNPLYAEKMTTGIKQLRLRPSFFPPEIVFEANFEWSAVKVIVLRR